MRAIELSDDELEKLEKLRQRWRLSSAQDTLRWLIKLAHLAVEERARRRQLGRPGAAGEEEHHRQGGGDSASTS